MVLKLYGFPLSVCTRRAVIALVEKGVPYELVVVNPLAGETKTSEYRENMQPFSQIPVLEDDGLIIRESRAIARYIAAKYANQGTPDLIPTSGDFTALAAFEQACSTEYAQFDPVAEGLMIESLVKRIKGLPSNDSLIDSLAAQLSEKMESYEIILSKQTYLAGDNITLADLLHLPVGFVLTTMMANDALTNSVRPNVLRWWNDISSRESWKSIAGNGAAEEKALYQNMLDSQKGVGAAGSSAPYPAKHAAAEAEAA